MLFVRSARVLVLQGPMTVPCVGACVRDDGRRGARQICQYLGAQQLPHLHIVRCGGEEVPTAKDRKTWTWQVATKDHRFTVAGGF